MPRLALWKGILFYFIFYCQHQTRMKIAAVQLVSIAVDGGRAIFLFMSRIAVCIYLLLVWAHPRKVGADRGKLLFRFKLLPFPNERFLHLCGFYRCLILSTLTIFFSSSSPAINVFWCSDVPTKQEVWVLSMDAPVWGMQIHTGGTAWGCFRPARTSIILIALLPFLKAHEKFRGGSRLVAFVAFVFSSTWGPHRWASYKLRVCIASKGAALQTLWREHRFIGTFIYSQTSFSKCFYICIYAGQFNLRISHLFCFVLAQD